MAAKTTVTLLHKNCGRNCNICAYGPAGAIGYDQIATITDTLMRQGYRVHLFDFQIKSESIAIFRRTRQFEGKNPGWMNVNPDFEPTPEELDYINQLQTALVTSLHGSTPEIHRRASGKDDWAEIVRFLEDYPRRYRRPLGINYVVSRHNLQDLEAMMTFGERFNLAFLEFIPMGYSGNAVARMGPDAILSAEEKYQAYRTVIEHGAGRPFAVELDAIWGPDFVRDPVPKCRFFAPALPDEYCNAGINHFAIRLNDLKVFPCPCMAGIDELAAGIFDGERLVIEDNWMDHKDRFGEPCQSCDKREVCRGGCRLTAMSDYQISHQQFDRFAGFDNCLYALAQRYGMPAVEDPVAALLRG